MSSSGLRQLSAPTITAPAEMFGGLPDVLTVEQTAAALHVSAQTVRCLLQRRELPGRKVGHRWCVPRNHLAAFLSGGA